ncbi:MAG: hypothetical protein M1822_008709 [Bathelium mastoideum]|nr:MAG: hypothetical protein M1822_008709 [Bathelium mastoideum]
MPRGSGRAQKGQAMEAQSKLPRALVRERGFAPKKQRRSTYAVPKRSGTNGISRPDSQSRAGAGEGEAGTGGGERSWQAASAGLDAAGELDVRTSAGAIGTGR